MMRPPRVRFTIRRLMVAVLGLGLILWGVVIPHVDDQVIVVKQAEARYKQAELVRKVIEYDIRECVEGIYGQDLITHHGRIVLTKSDWERAIDRLKWSKQRNERGMVQTLVTSATDRLTKQQAEFDPEQARLRFRTLANYATQQRIKSLNSDLKKAKAREFLAFAIYQVEKAKLFLLGH